MCFFFLFADSTMLKHVSYRASNTSLSRPLGNCRANTLSPQDKSHQNTSSISSSMSSPISAPNSPRLYQYPRHNRNNSIIPATEKYSSLDETDSPCIRDNSFDKQLLATHRHTCNGPLFKSCSLIRPTEHSLKQNESQENGDDQISLKADDPLSRHRNEMRSVDCLTLRGELMPHLPSHCDNSDNISLNSAISITSLCRNDLRASTTSLSSSKVS